LNYI
jgi:hypothetical protein